MTEEVKEVREEKKEEKEAIAAEQAADTTVALAAAVADLTAKWKRAVADYRNLEKRVEKEREDGSRLVNWLLLRKLIGVLDNLEKASFHRPDSGLTLIIDEFKNILLEQGLKEIAVVVGSVFDPHLHECVEIVAGEEDQKIVEVVAKGYIMGDRVVRPAKVKVSQTNAAGAAAREGGLANDV